MLYAVVRGVATLRIGSLDVVLRAGTGAWVPAGEAVGVRPAPGAILIPVPAAGENVTGVTRVAIPESALPALLRAFANVLGHLDGAQAPLLTVRGGVPDALAAPPAPRSAELRELAALLRAAPTADLAQAVHETVPGWSLRTVQRRFREDTGWTLAAWRRRHRLRAGAELVAAGRDLEWVANKVGYASLAGFIRAFADAAGVTPGQWREDRRDAECRTAEIVTHDDAQTHRTWSRVNGSHVAVWAAIGPAELVCAGRSLPLAEGEAVVIPAGTRNEVRIPAGSVLMPLGYRSALRGSIGAPLAPAQIGGLESLDMLEAMLASYTTVGVVGVDPDRGFGAALAGSRRAPVTPDDGRLAALANLFVREPELRIPDAATRLGTSERELYRLVQARTGDQFAAWLRMLRMTRARNQLGDGETPSEVSRELGYAHLPAFSRAFRAVHGAGPAALGVPNLSATRAAWGREQRLPARQL
ncbi:helix-turn-helix transcriptional regulator [Leucobacter sp. BZR 635]